LAASTARRSKLFRLNMFVLKLFEVDVQDARTDEHLDLAREDIEGLVAADLLQVLLFVLPFSNLLVGLEAGLRIRIGKFDCREAASWRRAPIRMHVSGCWVSQVHESLVPCVPGNSLVDGVPSPTG